MEKFINLKDYSQPILKYNLSTTIGKPIKFGVNNQLPIEILNSVNNSPIQKAILDSKISFTLGTGMKTNSVKSPNFNESWGDLYNKCVTDYCTFGAFAFQVILNKDEKTYSFFHQPVEQVRLGNYDKTTNTITNGFVNSDWSRGESTKYMVTLPMWGSETPEIGKRYLMYCKPYKPNELFYAVPDYYSLMNWIRIDVALSKYYLNFIKNNMSTNKVIKYPEVLTDEEIKELYGSLEEQFSGEQNAGGVMLLFGSNGVLPEIDELSSTDSTLYNTLSDLSFQYLVSGNKLTSPMLAGLQAKTGFSSTADELLTAYELYLNTIIYDLRDFVIDRLKHLSSINGLNLICTVDDINIIKKLEGEENNSL